MNEKESDGEAALLPRLPNQVVLFHVISRLPWYARPVCRALSKAWRLWIDSSTKRPDILIQSRQHLLPLLRSHFLLWTIDNRIFVDEACHGPCREQRSGYRSVHSSWEQTYQIYREWRELPSLQYYFSQMPSGLMAMDGTVYAFTSEEPLNFISKMDLAAGDWTWKNLPVPIAASFDHSAVSFNRKIYFPNVLVTGEEGKLVVVHDMTTEEFGLVKTWNQIDLRVLNNKISSESSSGLCEEELYSFIKHMAVSESGPKLEFFVYDACNDSWMTKFMLSMPDSIWQDVSQMELANRDSFEPVPDGGINIVWHDPDSLVLSWFNSSLHETWVHFDYDLLLEDKCLKSLRFIHGCLYGVFKYEYDKNGVEEETDPPLYTWTIIKGKMVVETSNVQWEEVLDIGCFPDSNFWQVEEYTFMA